MKGFVRRALEKIPKLDSDQIRQILEDVATENERLRVVLDSMNDGVAVSDTDHTVTVTNRAFERLVPLAAGKFAGVKKIWDAIADEDIRDFVRRTIEDEDSVAGREFALETDGAATRILNLSVFPLVHDGRIQGSVVQVSDVSESRGREARLRRAESLASLTTLAAGIAHEIKNPLGSIGIHTQLVQRALLPFQNEGVEEMRENLAIIDEEIQRLNKIVVDFLFAVRPMDTQPVDCDLNEIISELFRFVQYELEEGGVELQMNLDPELPILRIDEKYFKQALMNIVKKAITAMPDGGILRVSTRRRGDDAILRITDNGVGMNEEVLSKIFEPYFTTRDFGSGIGLTMVYKVVKEHMGDISVHSRPGTGTTFTITLPVPQREKHLLAWGRGEE